MTAHTQAVIDVLAERERHMAVEGWTPEHDDEHNRGEMTWAATCYTTTVAVIQRDPRGATLTPDEYATLPAPDGWPWLRRWWKPRNPRRDLVRAASLLIAEIERIDRAAVAKATGT